jgi:hypothetical protein
MWSSGNKNQEEVRQQFVPHNLIPEFNILLLPEINPAVYSLRL